MIKVTVQDIEKVNNAYDFLKSIYQVDDILNITLPIKPEEIAKRIDKLNFKNNSSFRDFNKSGYVKVNRSNDSKFEDIDLWVNPSEHPNRQRFTIAHEIGHLVFDVIPKLNEPTANEIFVDQFNRDGASNPSEVKANKFAAQLLMPLEHVKKSIKDLTAEMKNKGQKIAKSEVIELMANKFEVSTMAMEIRLKNLGYID